MADKPTTPNASQPGVQEQKPRDNEGSGSGMKQGMAQMMANCSCGPEMMAKMAGLMGGCGPSKGAEPAKEKP